MKAAVIGLGVGKDHVQAYRDAGVEVVCVVDRDRALRESFECANAASIGTVSEPAPGLNDADVVSICTYDQYHFEQVKICLELGKHVIVEKPPCLRSDETHRLRAMVEASGLFFACNLPLILHPSFLEFAARDHGDIYMIEGEYNWGRKSKLQGWRKNCPDYSMVLGGGLHIIDLMLAIKQWQIVDGAAFGVGDKILDTVESIFKFADGTLGRLTVNGGYEGEHRHRIVVSGSNGLHIWNNQEVVDKGAIVRKAVRYIEEKRHWDNARLWHGLEICFGIERNARQA